MARGLADVGRAETAKSRLVRVSFGRVGLTAQTIRDVLMGRAAAADAA